MADGKLPLPPNSHRTAEDGQVVGSKHPVLPDLDLQESTFVMAVVGGKGVVEARRIARLPSDYVVSLHIRNLITKLKKSIGQAELMNLPVIMSELWRQYQKADANGDHTGAANILGKIVTIGVKVPKRTDEEIDTAPNFDEFGDEADPLADNGSPS